MLLISILFLCACGEVLIPPNRPQLDNTLPVIDAAARVAEEVLGVNIDLNLIFIWSANRKELETCGGVGQAGCYQDGNILVIDELDIQSFCQILAHELVHAGADQNNINRDHNHDRYDWDSITGHDECTSLGL